MPEDNRIARSSVVVPLLLIGVGVLFLLTRWYPDFDPWPVLWKYWPLLLIFIGAGMFWDIAQRRRDPIQVVKIYRSSIRVHAMEGIPGF